MGFFDYFSKQARRPEGLFGRFFMSRVFEKGNAPLNNLVYETLLPKGNERILEIGFGTGLLINKIASVMESGIVTGVDFSDTMVSIAKRKNRKYIKDGRVKIHHGNFNETDFKEISFDKIFSINTVYFWESPTETVSRIISLLKPGGAVYIGLHGRDDMEKMPLNREVFNYYSEDDIVQILKKDGGFKEVKVMTSADEEGRKCICVKGIC